MLDARFRRWIDRPLDRLGAGLARAGVSANQVTLFGFGIGVLGIVALALRLDLLALVLLGLNRIADGLDGAVARQGGRLTDFGGYLDIVCDFLIYAGFVFGFAVGRPEHALPAAFLIFSFVGTGSTFLAYAIFAAKRGIETSLRGHKSLYYIGGLTEGTETIALLAAICLFPAAFPWLAYGFGAACWLTTAARAIGAYQAFGRAGSPSPAATGPASGGPPS